MNNIELKTGETWVKQFGIRMKDEDGWNPRSEYYTKEICEEEFIRKITHCTCSMPFCKELTDKLAAYL